jgi:preprotein translocase subunit SecA
LHEKASILERGAIIERCIAATKITLCTSTYIRGTDFKCRDKELQRNGGVHVVLTFYPRTAADMIQAKGRTCRQNDPGSFQIILYEEYLKDSGMIENIHEKETFEGYPEDIPEPEKWDFYLQHRQKSFETDDLTNMRKHLANNQPLEDKTYDLIRAIEGGDDTTTNQLLLKIHSRDSSP